MILLHIVMHFIKTYVRFTKELVRRFDGGNCEPSFVKNKNSNTLHELERPIKPTPLHIFKGDKNMHDSFPREKSPLLEEPSSIGEDTLSLHDALPISLDVDPSPLLPYMRMPHPQ